ncbi:MAG TPA: endonuclease/exonuclease/phosphatase family protein [Pseudolabrys sp.]|nr:endonuclease/exonuclease/phosphatase family protein [Pseudolabrys sp.]
MTAAHSIRLLTWNIHGTFGLNPRFDLVRAIELIRKWSPDIVALQEVDSRRQSSDGDPFELLQRALGKHGISARSITTADGHYGQILVSCCPICRSKVLDISRPEREPRRAIMAEIETPAGMIRVVATHLGLSIGERRGQARELLSLAGPADMPTVVMGDFNDWLWAGSVRAVLARQLPGRSRFRTFPSFWPLLKLDRIFCRPAAALQTCMTDRSARTISDHLPIIADVAI